MIKKYVKVVIFIKMYVCMQHLVPPKPSVCCGPPPPLRMVRDFHLFLLIA